MSPEGEKPTALDVAFGCLLLLAAFWLRLVVAQAVSAEPVWDGHYYDYGAKRIAAGLGYSDDVQVLGVPVWHPWCHYPVGYSAYLGAFYKLFGAKLSVARFVNALTGAALAPVTWLLARHPLSTTRSRAAGVLVALHPGLVLYSALVMTEQLAALTTLLSFLLALSMKKKLHGVVLGALALGVSALVRPQALLCAPFLLFVLHAKWPGVKKVIAHTAAITLLSILPVLPWTVRNCQVMDGCALVSTNGGWNLAIGAFPRATGRFETLRSSDGCRDVTGQVQQDRCWFAYGLGQIAAHPIHWVALVPKKLGYTFDHESFVVGYLHEARPDEWPDTRATKVREALTFGLRLLACAAVLGCIAFGGTQKGKRGQVALGVGAAVLAYVSLSADEPHAWPLVLLASVLPFVPLRGAPAFAPAWKLCAALVGTTALTHAVFFGEDRYHMVVIPVFCIYVAGALRAPGHKKENGAPLERDAPSSA